MKNIKIKYKLLMLVAFMLTGFILMGITSLRTMDEINEGSTVISANWLPSVIASEELNTLTSDYRIQEYKHIVAQDSQTMQEAERKLEELEAQINEMFDTYFNALITNDTDKQLMQNAQSAWKKYLELHDNMLELSRQNKTEEAMAAVLGSASLFNEASEQFLETVNFNKSGADQASREGNELYKASENMTIATLAVIGILSLLFAIYIIRSINIPVAELDEVARQIAEGNLNKSIRYQSRDELGSLAVNFNRTVERLRDYVDYIDEISRVLKEIAGGNLAFELTFDYAGEFAKIKEALEAISQSLNDTMGQINQTSAQVAAGSDQVSSGAQALSQGATEQASSVEELAATISEISGQVSKTAENAAMARSQATQAGEEITICNKQMQDMINAMDEISHKSSEIGKIIKTIEDIAFQTNILALNAAVEAARAGAAGKGFAVVADEVRNLASKSAEASQNTSALIAGSIEAVQKGTKLANETAQSLIQVVQGAQSTSATVEKIAQAAEDQASSLAQVTQGIDQISSVVQTNSATAEESAAASEELSGQAQILKGLVGQFKLRG